MTRPHARHLRITWVDKKQKPWVVQSCLGTRHGGHAWQDIMRFERQSDATKYVDEIRARDRILLEAER